MKKSMFIVAGLLLLSVLVNSCAPQAETAVAEPAAAEAMLTVSGAVSASLAEADLKAMPVTEADYTNKDGETTTYSGVSFTDLLNAVKAEAFTNLTLVAADDYSVDVTADEISACPNCIVALDDGSLRSVMPDFGGKFQVKDLVEIKVN